MHDVTHESAAPAPNAARMFALLWAELHDVMGSAATAALLRRAAKHARARAPELGGFDVQRARFDYRYVVPPEWAQGPRPSLDALMQELRPLLVELTGPVVLRRLHRIPELQSCGHFSPEVVT